MLAFSSRYEKKFIALHMHICATSFYMYKMAIQYSTFTRLLYNIHTYKYSSLQILKYNIRIVFDPNPSFYIESEFNFNFSGMTSRFIKKAERGL